MEKYFDINEDGHSIRCKVYYQKDLHAVTHWVVATHGFGSNKDNKAVAKFAERITTKYKGYGVVCFDWPCHGKDARNHMILSECLDYLDHVNRHVMREPGTAKVYNYSSSMGAYFTLLYLHEQHLRGQADPYEKIALRCPAIHLYEAMLRQMSKEDLEKLAKKKEVQLGFERKVVITEDFLEELRQHNLSDYEFFDDADRILILHGTKDAMVPIAETAAFADANVIEMIPVENADHPFSNPASMDYAVQKIIEFFAP